jgi:hypothetical protein
MGPSRFHLSFSLMKYILGSRTGALQKSCGSQSIHQEGEGGVKSKSEVSPI